MQGARVNSGMQLLHVSIAVHNKMAGIENTFGNTIVSQLYSSKCVFLSFASCWQNTHLASACIAVDQNPSFGCCPHLLLCT